jgi:hypothetical protein
MAPRKKKQPEEPTVPDPIAVDEIAARYMSEVYNRTELERQAAIQLVRKKFNVPDNMVFNPQIGAFMVPQQQPTGPELLPDAD